MIEREMGYRGSKSVKDFNIPTSQIINPLTVKEQRVDGSWCINHALAKHKKLMHLRCTLMGFERNYQVRIPSNLIKTSRNNYSVLSSLSKLELTINPCAKKNINLQWISGFIDAEGCFMIQVYTQAGKTGWGVTPSFSIHLHIKDIDILYGLQNFFGVGIVYLNKNGKSAIYMVRKLKDITNVIIPHFDSYPLISQKRADYLLFRQAIYLLLDGQAQSSIGGIHEILSIKASMNNGLSDKLKINFPTVLPLPRPVVSGQDIPDPSWLAGFVCGEASFYVKLAKNKRYSTGFNVTLVFSMSQHIRDEALLTKLIDYLGCGRIERASTRSGEVNFTVSKFSDIKEKVIPFFHSYPLRGIKHRDYLDFVKAAKIVEVKGHLTVEGLNQIRAIKAGMNTGRV